MTRRTADGAFDLDLTITETYFGLRWGTVGMAVVLPLLLWFGGFLFHHRLPLQASLSAYYYTDMRDWFVGILFAVAACLYLYKGLGDLENYLLNAAAVLAVGVAVNPSGWLPDWWFLPSQISPHGICAVSFFVMIALACWLCQDDSLNLGLIPERQRTRFRMKYNAIGVALVALPAVAVYLNIKVLMRPASTSIFWAEAVAIWVFSFYWYTKSGELKEAIEAQVERRRHASGFAATA